jgi:hypothetical protein
MDDVPVQYFQSVIAIQLAVTGALLWNIHYFDRRPSESEEHLPAPSPWRLLVVSIVLAATLFGCLHAILHGGQETAASAVTIGLALSMTPILLRVLPPLRAADRPGRASHAPVTVLGLLLYFAVVGGVVATIHG